MSFSPKSIISKSGSPRSPRKSVHSQTEVKKMNKNKKSLLKLSPVRKVPPKGLKEFLIYKHQDSRADLDYLDFNICDIMADLKRDKNGNEKIPKF